MMTQLQPPIPLTTPKGRAWAVALIDYGPQWDLQWVTFLNDSGECWTFRNSQIRREENYTFGLGEPSAINRPSMKAGGMPAPERREGPEKKPSMPVRDPNSSGPQIKEPSDKEPPIPHPTPSLSPAIDAAIAVNGHRNGHMNGHGVNGSGH